MIDCRSVYSRSHSDMDIPTNVFVNPICIIKERQNLMWECNTLSMIILTLFFAINHSLMRNVSLLLTKTCLYLAKDGKESVRVN